MSLTPFHLCCPFTSRMVCRCHRHQGSNSAEQDRQRRRDTESAKFVYQLFTRAFPDYETQFSLATRDSDSRNSSSSSSSNNVHNENDDSVVDENHVADKYKKKTTMTTKNAPLHRVHAVQSLSVSESTLRRLEPPLTPTFSDLLLLQQLQQQHRSALLNQQQQQQQQQARMQQQYGAYPMGLVLSPAAGMAGGMRALGSPLQWTAAFAPQQQQQQQQQPQSQQQGVGVVTTPPISNFVSSNNYLMSVMNAFGMSGPSVAPTFFSPGQLRHPPQTLHILNTPQTTPQTLHILHTPQTPNTPQTPQFQQALFPQQQQSPSIRPQQQTTPQKPQQQQQQQQQQQETTPQKQQKSQKSQKQQKQQKSQKQQAAQQAAQPPKKRGRPPKKRNCSTCNKDENDQDLLACVTCKARTHTYCHTPNLSHLGVEWRNNWNCQMCKKCEHCEQAGKQLIVCENCERAHHTYCLIPPLARMPRNSWICPHCISQGVVPISSRRAREISAAPEVGYYDDPSDSKRRRLEGSIPDMSNF